MTKTFHSITRWLKFRKFSIPQNKSIGFVPTMGNLHAGHKSLLQRSKCENDITVLSIFVNPTQFDDINDLKKYPRTLKRDLKIAKECGVDFVLIPTREALYPDNYSYKIIETELSNQLCGKFRLNHFSGVLTIVLKLLQLVHPTRAYFGEKDFQQLTLVKGLVRAFFIDTKIIPCPTIRDEDGLALSSRNNLLPPKQLILAKQFPKLLKSKYSKVKIINSLNQLGFKIDYIEDIAGRRFGAVRLGKVRLIDNIKI